MRIRYDYANVTVSVINLNDNPPVFVRDGRIPIDSIGAMILEELPPQSTVATLQVRLLALSEYKLYSFIYADSGF